MNLTIISLAFLAVAFPSLVRSQVVNEPPARTIRVTKAGVVSLAVSPKGDQLLVGLTKGAELYDLESGKRIHAYAYSEDGGTAVYHVGFNENGEYAVLIGHSGKRTVWGVGTGKQEKVISEHRWVPDPRAVKAMGLDMKNSTFDRFPQQGELDLGKVKARSGKHGIVEFLDADGKVMQKLTVPENKDQHHRAPLLMHEGSLLVGTDDGRVLFYPLP